MTIDSSFTRNFYFEALFSVNSFAFHCSIGDKSYDIEHTYIAFTDKSAGIPITDNEANSLRVFMSFFRSITPKERSLWFDPDVENGYFRAISFACEKNLITVCCPSGHSILMLIGCNPYQKLKLLRPNLAILNSFY